MSAFDSIRGAIGAGTGFKLHHELTKAGLLSLDREMEVVDLTNSRNAVLGFSNGNHLNIQAIAPENIQHSGSASSSSSSQSSNETIKKLEALQIFVRKNENTINETRQKILNNPQKYQERLEKFPETSRIMQFLITSDSPIDALQAAIEHEQQIHVSIEELDNAISNSNHLVSLNKKIDSLNEPFSENMPTDQRILTLIAKQKNSITPFIVTRDEEAYAINANHPMVQNIVELQELRDLCVSNVIDSHIENLRQLRLDSPEIYERKMTEANPDAKALIDFLTNVGDNQEPEIDSQKALKDFEAIKENHPNEPLVIKKAFAQSMQMELYCRYREYAKEVNRNPGGAKIDFQQTVISEMYQEFKESGYGQELVMKYFSELGLQKATDDFLNFAKEQFIKDFHRTTIIIDGMQMGLEIPDTPDSPPNKESPERVDSADEKIASSPERNSPKPTKIDWNANQVLNAMQLTLTRPQAQTVRHRKGETSPPPLSLLQFAELLLFASQAGDAEYTQFALKEHILMPIVGDLKWSNRELKIDTEKGTVEKDTTTKRAVDVGGDKDPVSDGDISIKQTLNFRTGVKLMFFPTFHDENKKYMGT